MTGSNSGWTCPVCGTGMAPWMSKCNCVNGGGTQTTTMTSLMEPFDIGTEGQKAVRLPYIPTYHGIVDKPSVRNRPHPDFRKVDEE